MAVIHSLATVLEYNSSTGVWKSSVLDLLAQSVTVPEVCYIFLESGDWYKNYCPEPDRKKILAHFQAPDFLSNKTCTDLNGYFGSQSSFVLDGRNKDKLQGLSMWFRILTKKVLKPEEKTDEGKDYLWYEMGFFTQWSSLGACRVLCIGTPRKVSSELKTLLTMLQPPSFELRDPFAMLRPLFDEVIKECDENTWRMSEFVRAIELNRKAEPEFERLRNLARHIGHLVEVEQVAIETIEQLVSRQESHFKDLPESLTKTYRIQAREYLMFQLQTMKSLRCRAQSTHNRLEEEITLAYNMLASSDNAIIKSITLLTMIVLPATFISVSTANMFMFLSHEVLTQAVLDSI
ncbi:MAG: hypothetical protein M1825_002330 [Sarcosagium campestre]|nr:MAG: hypothetical protein M1825_002330 [Sarcosagium campestre]